MLTRSLAGARGPKCDSGAENSVGVGLAAVAIQEDGGRASRPSCWSTLSLRGLSMMSGS